MSANQFNGNCWEGNQNQQRPYFNNHITPSFQVPYNFHQVPPPHFNSNFHPRLPRYGIPPPNFIPNQHINATIRPTLQQSHTEQSYQKTSNNIQNYSSDHGRNFQHKSRDRRDRDPPRNSSDHRSRRHPAKYVSHERDYEKRKRQTDKDESKQEKESKRPKKELEDDFAEFVSGTAEDIQQKLKSLSPKYVQCTQHGQYYGRTTENNSTVVAREDLKELYKTFETQLSTRHFSLWKPNVKALDDEKLVETESEGQSDKSGLNLAMRLLMCQTQFESLPKSQQLRSISIVGNIEVEAKKMNKPLMQYIQDENPDVPDFALARLKSTIEKLAVKNSNESTQVKKEKSNSGNESDDDEILSKAGELITNIRKRKDHPDRLHDELWYNDPNQANYGSLCRCSENTQKTGIRHNIYPGESAPPKCDPYANNVKKMYNYLVSISPPVNFTSSTQSTIKHDGHEYIFEGFSLFSHEPLENLPLCDIIRFHIRYTIYLIEEPIPENFCVKGLDLFSDYFFRDILELYDWVKKDPSWPEDTETASYRKFRVFPRFVRNLDDKGKEILSLCEVLKHLLKSDKPLVDGKDFNTLMTYSHENWMKHIEDIRGMIVTYPGKKPSSLRIDQLDRYDRICVENPDSTKVQQGDDFPMIIHFGIRPANLSYAGDPQYQKTWRSYLKLRHLMANSPRVKQSDKIKLKKREEALQALKRQKAMQREVTVELSSKNFKCTGIYSDMCQHALLLPVLTQHIRYQLCLRNLEKILGYEFKDRKWLSHAMKHPSCQVNFGSNPDHVRNALSNCGLRQPKYGDSSIHYKYTRKRGITTLIRIMARLGQEMPVLSPIEHNERLEFLGDAVVGYLTSVHLFFLFPDLSEGALTTFRTVIVNNQHLAQLAERLHLHDYMLFGHGPDLNRNADLRHAMANCFEAVMGAIYMEAGLEKAREVFSRFLWDSTELQNVWLNLPLHPLQAEEKGSDREYIPSVPILQNLTKFEDNIGVKFNHIRVLAKSFTWRNVHDNVLTHGHNQRLEFLGDSVCNLVTSTYLFELYPTHHEGHLTLLRATMVNGHTQSLVATELGMPRFVIYNMGGENSSKIKAPEWREKNLADLLEAFIAALFIDKGLDFVNGFMQVCFFPRLKEFILSQRWNDPKSCLQQCCLTLRQEGKEPQLPTYEIANRIGPSHARKYEVTVYFKDRAIGTGSGDSIQEGERNAARKALEEYNFPQLEWQRRYVALKHNMVYQPRKNLKEIHDAAKR